MVDPLDRRTFAKDGPVLAEFKKTVKEIRLEMNDLLKVLFFSTDLEKRQEAFQNIRSLKSRYKGRLEKIPNERKEDLFAALQIDLKKIENSLKSVNIHVYMNIDGISVPLLSQETKKPFTLFDFWDDSRMLAEKDIWFQYHLPKMDPNNMPELFPGFEDPHFINSFEAKGRLRLPFTFSSTGIEYFLSPAQPSGSYHIEGRCQLKKLNHLVKFEIPHGVMPSDLNAAIDRVLGSP